MPSLANMTIKKNDGTTDAIYVAKLGAGQDGTKATLRYDAHPAPYAGLKPTFEITSRWNGPKTARRVEATLVFRAYQTDSTTGVSTQIGTIPITISAVIPQNLDQTTWIDESVAQAANLFKHADTQTMFKTGFAFN